MQAKRVKKFIMKKIIICGCGLSGRLFAEKNLNKIQEEGSIVTSTPIEPKPIDKILMPEYKPYFKNKGSKYHK